MIKQIILQSHQKNLSTDKSILAKFHKEKSSKFVPKSKIDEKAKGI